MKPFDLEAALKGAPVMTRGGMAVTELTRFHQAEAALLGVIRGKLYGWNLDGTHYTNAAGSISKAAYDLVMATRKITYWVNFYPDGNSAGYPTRAAADHAAAGSRLRFGGKARKLVLEVAE